MEEETGTVKMVMSKKKTVKMVKNGSDGSHIGSDGISCSFSDFSGSAVFRV